MPDPKPARVPALLYRRGEVPNIPARDLSPDDLAILASRSYVRRRYAQSAADLARFLRRTGVYTEAASETAASADSKGVSTDG